MRFIATAEHTGGKSVRHPCRHGAYDDPTDDFQFDIEAVSIAAAEQAAYSELERRGEAAEPCQCERKISPGTFVRCFFAPYDLEYQINTWLGSIAITLWPQEVPAAESLIADGYTHFARDVYGLVPSYIRELALAAEAAKNE